MKIIYCALVMALLLAGSCFASVTMTGNLKGFSQGKTKIVGENRISVKANYTSPLMKAPAKKAEKAYDKPIPSAYRFDALNKGISGKPKWFLSRYQK